ncbi:tryptophan synthase subunit alpha [Phycisphaerales bacterium AB-hyl4]|uniref:Tryptophan synthase alpha chain n=1 Tax=Natronomicrosphaera hydrolytica TaxID=3242702 RepID=A0ABV4U1Q0_9BACT
MNRIDRIFHDLRATVDSGAAGAGKALMPFITAGDPDLPTTAALLSALEQAGASIVELGIPFSDPIADGPVIEASMAHALGKGVRVHDVFEQVAAVRDKVDLGIVAMVSYSIVHRLGLKRFINEAKSAGFDGFIFPDLPLEEAPPAVEAARDADMILSMLIAPTTPIERARRIAQSCSGFIYMLSRAGITGERSELPVELPRRIARLREATELPIAVGFGISTADQVREVVAVADAAIVGSAIVRQVAANRDKGSTAVVDAVASFTRQLATGLPSVVR